MKQTRTFDPATLPDPPAARLTFMQLVDSHCHLNFPDFDGRIDDILRQAMDADVKRLLCIATSWENRGDVLALARAHASISASTGVHPTTTSGHEPGVDELLDAAADPEVVAIGETGLDYFRFEGVLESTLAARSAGALAWQHERFHRHIETARRAELPLIIHTRAAADDTMETLREHGARDAGGVMHCFAEDWGIAEQALDLGFYISFSGIVTFKSAKAIQEVARRAPLERILVETDAPYLAPVPHRGKTNEPAYVRHTAEYVAQLRDISLEKLAEATTENFHRLFAAVPKDD